MTMEHKQDSYAFLRWHCEELMNRHKIYDGISGGSISTIVQKGRTPVEKIIQPDTRLYWRRSEVFDEMMASREDI